MPFQPAVNVAQVTLHGRQDNQETVNDLYFLREVGEINAVDLFELLDAVCTWYLDSIGSYASDTWSFVRGHARDLSSATGISVDNADHIGPGGVGGAAAPNNVSFAISFRTDLGGRSGRGRNYIPGIPDQALLGNTITNDFILNYINGYSALKPGGGVLPANWLWVVLSRQTGGAVRPAGVTYQITSVVVTDNVVDSQRRRLPGRGR